MVTSQQGANNTGKPWKMWWLMSLIPGSRTAPMTKNPVEPGPPAHGNETPVARPAARAVPGSRFGTAWVGLCVAAVMTIAFVVFMAQNTRSTPVSFLWMTGSTSLVVALLIAAAGGMALTLVVGTARITQLRRFGRRH
jgi:uncharacterized integral membrane protein